VVLALGLVGVQLWQSGQGQPGPEWPTVTGHLIAAALAVMFQRFADRRRDMMGALAAAAVFAVVAVTLWIWWLG
jgi:phosphotransferase system  glucose/maltose/N-acetylglucosamine-specific IIC component